MPALLGNIIGGGIFVGVLYWYLHLQGRDEILIDNHGYKSRLRTSHDLARWVRSSERKEEKESKSYV
jgi:hypothetical protein